MTTVFHPSRASNNIRSYKVKDRANAVVCPTCEQGVISWVFIDLSDLFVEYRCKLCCPLEVGYVS